MCATLSFLCTVSNMHSVTYIAARRRGLMHIKAVDNQLFIFLPTFFVLMFRTICFTEMEKKFRVGSTKGRVGSPEPDIFFFIPPKYF